MLPRADDGSLLEPLQLPPGNVGPRTGTVQLEVELPVLDGLQYFAGSFAQKRQVEMCVSVLRV